MSSRYDLVVIGTGTAAMVAAMRVRNGGRTVAVVDHRPFGGTCALRGCDPKKMLVSGARALDHARRMQGKGIEGDLQINWHELIAFKRSFTDPIPDKHNGRYAEKGIVTYRGHARFTGRNSLEIDGESIEGRQILIASGAEPVQLGIPGEEHLIDNEQFLGMERLPKRIVLVGGGYIAAEFSHVAARAGAEVVVLQRGSRLLKHFDPDLVSMLMTAFKQSGIRVCTDTQVTGISRAGDGYRVQSSRGQENLEFDADCVVHAAGRSPALESLNLSAAGVAVERGRLVLNDYLQSVSNEAVYAAGDAAQVGPPLTPVSSHDAKVVAANMLEGNHRKPDYRGVPSVAFTLPPIASAGLSEAAAREQGLDFRCSSGEVPDWFTARQAAESVYGFKVLVERSSDRILGAHLVGPYADEVINIFALAIRQGLTTEQLKTTMFAYPTGASDIGDML